MYRSFAWRGEHEERVKEPLLHWRQNAHRETFGNMSSSAAGSFCGPAHGKHYALYRLNKDGPINARNFIEGAQSDGGGGSITGPGVRIRYESKQVHLAVFQRLLCN